jgi:beta-1,4-galactosyltransferase 4
LLLLLFEYRVEGYFKNRYFGGATAFTKEQFVTINGFSNSYYGWGLEDDDARERVLSKFKSIKRLTPQVGRYYANCHKQSTKNPNRFILYIKACLQRQVTDGLNSLAYSIEKIEKSYLYTKIYIHYKNDY